MVITGKGIHAEMRNEKPDEYVARIREESRGGCLLFTDEKGVEVARTAPIRWAGTSGHDLVAVQPTQVPNFAWLETLWLRLLKPNGDDTGWRGPSGYATLIPGAEPGEISLGSLRIYPPK